jgi:hypothetical protein
LHAVATLKAVEEELVDAENRADLAEATLLRVEAGTIKVKEELVAVEVRAKAKERSHAQAQARLQVQSSPEGIRSGSSGSGSGIGAGPGAGAGAGAGSGGGMFTGAAEAAGTKNYAFAPGRRQKEGIQASVATMDAQLASAELKLQDEHVQYQELAATNAAERTRVEMTQAALNTLAASFQHDADSVRVSTEVDMPHTTRSTLATSFQHDADSVRVSTEVDMPHTTRSMLATSHQHDADSVRNSTDSSASSGTAGHG